MRRDTLIYKVLHGINLFRIRTRQRVTLLLFDKWYYDTPFPDQIRKYKGIHEGERCFIIGNGPSLTVSDLEKINKEITFSCNKIYEYSNSSYWKPYYYVVDDTGYVKNDYENIINVASKAKFIGIEYDKKLAKPYLNSNVIILRKKTLLDGMLPRWSIDVDNYIGSGHTVTFLMVQLAIYMGFKEIYFLGQDCSTLPDKTHFYNSEKNDMSDNDLNNFIYAFYSIKKLAEESGVKVYNATRGGKLEVFERIDLEKFLEERE